MPISSFDDLESRKPIWIALSNLFLDTEIGLLIESTAQELARSPYSVEEIEEILVGEVYPACKYSLWSIVGEWAGFDEESLIECVMKKRGRISTYWNRFFGKLGTVTSNEWKQTKYRIIQIRNQTST